MKKVIQFTLILCLAGGFLYKAMAATSDQADIYGTVKDASGAIMLNVQVTARNGDTGFVRTGMTDAEGTFILPALPVGPYEVTAQAAGFATQIQTGLTLVLNQRLAVNFTMQVSAVATAVTVESSALEISLNQSQIGSNVTPAAVTSLPLDGRNFVDLATLVPGITVGGGIPISGGQQLRSKNLVVDGASEKEDYGVGFVAAFPSSRFASFRWSPTGLARSMAAPAAG